MFTTSVGVFVFGLLATIAGGAVGAAIGGNYAFVLTGFCVLASWGVFAATGNGLSGLWSLHGPAHRLCWWRCGRHLCSVPRASG